MNQNVRSEGIVLSGGIFSFKIFDSICKPNNLVIEVPKHENWRSVCTSYHFAESNVTIFWCRPWEYAGSYFAYAYSLKYQANIEKIYGLFSNDTIVFKVSDLLNKYKCMNDYSIMEGCIKSLKKELEKKQEELNACSSNYCWHADNDKKRINEQSTEIVSLKEELKTKTEDLEKANIKIHSLKGSGIIFLRNLISSFRNRKYGAR